MLEVPSSPIAPCGKSVNEPVMLTTQVEAGGETAPVCLADMAAGGGNERQ